MYFKNFPTVYYAFPNADSSDIKLQILTDITSNVRFRKQMLENVTLYDEYDIEEGETPEIIAEKIYGNPEYHWVIMILNERYNYLEDFPMSENELNTYIAQTYGNKKYNVHHYEQNGVITEAKGLLKIPSVVYTINRPAEEGGPYTVNLIDLIKVGDKMQTLSGYFCTVTAVPPTTSANQVAVRFDSEAFKNADAISLLGVRLTEDELNYEYKLVTSFTLPSSNAVELIGDYDIVTNEMYEIRRNESKRRIKLISPTLLDQIITEFEDLL